MAKRASSRYRHDHPGAMAVAGAGLILIGAALFLILGNPQSGSAAPGASREWSVVPAEVHYPAPELSLTGTDGEPESLADFRQDILLVNNWAVWCPPCKAEMPTLEAYYESHAAEGLMVIAIEAGDSRDTVLNFASNYGLKFHVWVDPQNASLAVFRNSSLPNSYVIDRTGTVRYAWTGAISRLMLEKYITPLLASSD